MPYRQPNSKRPYSHIRILAKCSNIKCPFISYNLANIDKKCPYCKEGIIQGKRTDISKLILINNSKL